MSNANKLDFAAIREQIRAKAEAEKNRGQGGTFDDGAPSAFLAHWNFKEGDTLSLRFLEDADDTNPFFWREIYKINLTFKGVKGQHTDNVRLQVPCVEMWQEDYGKLSCPILNHIREQKWWDDEDTKELAKKYWKKPSFLYQCFVAPGSCEVEGDNPPENPIRRVLFTTSIHNRVKSIFDDMDVEEMPTHTEGGYDFRLTKFTDTSGFFNYSNSSFARKSRPLNEEERAAIEKYGLFNLSEFMPKKPNSEELTMIYEMFLASLNNEPYDVDRWGSFMRPAGVNYTPNNNTTSTTSSTSTATTPNVTASTEPKVEPKVEETVSTPSTDSGTTSTGTVPANDATSVLARLRQKQQQQQ